MKLETEINHIQNKIKTSQTRIEEYEKELHELYKKLSRRDFKEKKKLDINGFGEYVTSRLSNLYFLSNLDQSQFSRIQIDAEIEVLHELMQQHLTQMEKIVTRI